MAPEKLYNFNVVFTVTVLVFGSSFGYGYSISMLNLIKRYIMRFFSDVMYQRGTLKVNLNDSMLEDDKNCPPELLTLWQLTTALFIPGGVVGAILSGVLSDRIGRKWSIAVSHMFMIMGIILAVFCLVANSPEMLMVGRFIGGVNAGLGTTVVPYYISEVALPRARGALMTMHQLYITIGILIGNVFGLDMLFGQPKIWPYIYLIMFVPIIVSLAAMPFFPESPRYIIMKRQDPVAGRRALAYYRGTDDVDEELSDLVEEAKLQAIRGKKDFPICKLFGPNLRYPTFIACFLQVVQQLSGINAVMFYSAGIFKLAKVKSDMIQYAVLGTSAVNMCMTIVAVPIMDIAGRRKLLIYPMAAMIVDLAVLTVAIYYADDFSEMAILGIFCVMIYVVTFAIGLGPIPWNIAPELFLQDPRPKAMMLAIATNWIFTFIVAMSFEHIQRAAQAFTFLIFVILLIFFLIFVIICVPETKNKTFEQISMELGVRVSVMPVMEEAEAPLVVEEEKKEEGEEAAPAGEGAEGEGGEAKEAEPAA